MMTPKERAAVQQALEALEELWFARTAKTHETLAALREVLAEQAKSLAAAMFDPLGNFEDGNMVMSNQDAQNAAEIIYGLVALLESAEQAECPHGVDDGACKECYMEQAEPVAFVSDVYQSRYTLEWNGHSLPVGTPLYDHSTSQELEHMAEEAECVKLSLDKAGVPTADASGKVYSLWGRVCRYAEQAEQEPVLCVECGHPTMHMGNKCYLCCQKAEQRSDSERMRPAEFEGDDMVIVPRGLLGAAGGAISGKRDAPKTLELIRRYALSNSVQPVSQDPAKRFTSDDVKVAFEDGYAAAMSAVEVAKAVEQEPVAWWEFNEDIGAWFLAYTFNPKAKTRPLVFGDSAPVRTKDQK